MISVLIIIILLCSAFSDWAAAKDWEASERNKARRHREMMEALSQKKKTKGKTVRRRAIKEPGGRVLLEEVTFNDDDSDEDDSDEDDFDEDDFDDDLEDD